MLFIAVLFLVLTKILTSDNTTELSMSLRSSEHVRLCTHRHIYKTWSSFCAVGRAVHILPQIPCLFTNVVIETLQLSPPWHLLPSSVRKSALWVCSPETWVCLARHCHLCSHTCVDHVSALKDTVTGPWIYINYIVFSLMWIGHIYQIPA